MYEPLTNEERDTLAKAAVILTQKAHYIPQGAVSAHVAFIYSFLDYDAGDRPEIDADLVIAPDDVKLDFPADDSDHGAMKIYAYNENCALAGHEVPGDKIERSEGDWTCYEGTPEGLLDQADSLDFTDGSPGRANAFRLRVARLIRTEVYRYHPDLEQAR